MVYDVVDLHAAEDLEVIQVDGQEDDEISPEPSEKKSEKFCGPCMDIARAVRVFVAQGRRRNGWKRVSEAC